MNNHHRTITSTSQVPDHQPQYHRDKTDGKSKTDLDETVVKKQTRKNVLINIIKILLLIKIL